MPTWIKEGYQEYNKRLPHSCRLELIEIPPPKRNKQSSTYKELEGRQILSLTKPNHRLIALDTRGELWSTEELADEIKIWQESGRTIDMIIGGPDGLSDECLQKSEKKWSLSPLTFPHLLVRVLIAEQIYRANCILSDHPYHK